VRAHESVCTVRTPCLRLRAPAPSRKCVGAGARVCFFVGVRGACRRGTARGRRGSLRAGLRHRQQVRAVGARVAAVLRVAALPVGHLALGVTVVGGLAARAARQPLLLVRGGTCSSWEQAEAGSGDHGTPPPNCRGGVWGAWERAEPSGGPGRQTGRSKVRGPLQPAGPP